MVFTSGATGPAKGVVYTHGQLEAQRDLLAAAYAVDRRRPAGRRVRAVRRSTDRRWGYRPAVPDMDVTSPGTLTAAALADAVAAVDATLVFASPAALVNVMATASALSDDERPRWTACGCCCRRERPSRSPAARGSASWYRRPSRTPRTG